MSLSEQIAELEAYLAATCPEGAVDWDETIQLLGWLRELRARRIAMGRPADDERNAPADMCCCVPDVPFDDGCPMHPEPAEQRAEGCTPWQASWCAVHGDCSCAAERVYDDTADPDCPLHGEGTGHGGAVDPEYQ